ncbi:hypothetical protein ACIBG7_43005 [Nonomuraea sp. NPDC050328]|uniref:hypothetical protein n=1 Tax=Nonomuraea sp. NPDC050328 TaxID=3364361 RepID=UPI0037ACBC0B
MTSADDVTRRIEGLGLSFDADFILRNLAGSFPEAVDRALDLLVDRRASMTRELLVTAADLLHGRDVLAAIDAAVDQQEGLPGPGVVEVRQMLADHLGYPGDPERDLGRWARLRTRAEIEHELLAAGGAA